MNLGTHILPMSKSEIQKLDFVVKDLKNKHREDIENKMMSSGFATANILNFDNDNIFIELKYGTLVDVPELCFNKIIKVNRTRMEVIECVA